MPYLNNSSAVSDLFDRLFPLCRSITGAGYRRSLEYLKEYIPFSEIEYPTGRKVLNWIVPKEWVIRSGYLQRLSDGRKIADFNSSCLEIMNYSEAVNSILAKEELLPHLYVSKTAPETVPYVFSYYKRRWGFALTQKAYDELEDGRYHAFIDAEFVDGHVTVGETVLPSTRGSDKEILISSYLCHPAMANNELSGPLVQAMLYQRIQSWTKRKYNYRFVINPETIGSICYLSDHGEMLRQKLFAGMVLTCLGGSKKLSWKFSKSGDAPLDNFIRYINSCTPGSIETREFDPSEGSDERQYCSAGFNFPVGQMARLVYGTYPEYHTSGDSKELMGIENIMNSCDQLEKLLAEFEQDTFYVTDYPYGEVKLGDYNLYPSINSDGNRFVNSAMNDPDFVRTVMTLLSYADGKHGLSFTAYKLGKALQFVNLNFLKNVKRRVFFSHSILRSRCYGFLFFAPFGLPGLRLIFGGSFG
ncbi:MAG: DUF4910 domain-containing protein, partial [Succinivibrionaceae bacterium]|nr:DUF4910 domain-containing protein [Succinivibrionaceae bacterium]